MSNVPAPTHRTPDTPQTAEELAALQLALTKWDTDLKAYADQLDTHEKSRERALENRKNAEIEYDKLIVYLAGGGLVLTVGFVKDLTKAAETTRVGWLLGCWIGFALALLVNLVSHALTRLASDALLTDNPNWKKLDNRVNWANWIALFLVGMGIFAFLVFVYQNFPAHAQAQSQPQQNTSGPATGQRSNPRPSARTERRE